MPELWRKSLLESDRVREVVEKQAYAEKDER